MCPKRIPGEVHIGNTQVGGAPIIHPPVINGEEKMNWIERRALKKYGKMGDLWFYRCLNCQRLVTANQIAKGGCVCQAARVAPAHLSWWETVKMNLGLFYV